MTKAEFLTNAKPLVGDVNGQPIILTPKLFSTGSVGYNVTGKMAIKLANGVVVNLQQGFNLTAVKSKEWVEGDIPAEFKS